MVSRFVASTSALFIFFTVAPASAAPIPLVLPQSAALSLVGASCGGIQEQVYATGFDVATGYPTGVVSMSTRCGGSGRGGGYKVTTYSATATVMWDYTATVVSYARGSAAYDAALNVYDGFGNELYNAAGQAYLVLAPGFVPAPRVVSISPTTGPAVGGTKVTIAGAGFGGVSGVRFGGKAAASYTVVSSTSITAVAPASQAGVVDVTVANAGGGSASVAAARFTYVTAPAVSAVSPKSGDVAGGTPVTITGSHFADATQVSFGGVGAAFSVDSDTSITAYAPAAEAVGAVDVTVASIGGRSVRSAADRFAYTAVRPVVTSVSPSSGATDGGNEVSISGSGFGGATRVSFGGIAAQFYVDGDGSIVALTPPHAAGDVDVSVSGPGGTSLPTSAADRFAYLPAPVVTGLSPASGPVDGDTEVTIAGSGFATATDVYFGGVSAAFFVNDDSSITAIAPTGLDGVVDVSVTGLNGTSAVVGEDQFTYE